MTGGSVWLRIVNFAYVPLSFYGIALTGSRSGVACGLLGVGFLLVRVLRARPALRLALVPAALAVVALSFFSVPPRTAERVEGTREEDLSGRLQIWREGLQLFYRRPLLGVGSGAFQTAVNSGKPPHNFAISVLAELGIPGLLCYLGLLAVAAYHGLRGTQPLLWLALLSVCFITAMVHNVEDKKQTWLFLSLAVASQRPVARVVAGERRAVV